ncbi:MAG TPA: peptide chain release factor N(5)-glutamine methyltransferase [Gemmatimonadaceae bacterium]|jgi:release factor glutamine methyltransferase|nr:peptide chain release factor N(5)-glutamine methyltransferase [Gemmatimonadaceae bacterium]
MTTERLSDAVNVSRLLEDLARQLNSAGINEPFSESREIVAALYDVPRFWPLMNGNLDVDAETLSRARTAVEKRIQGAPLAYAVGRASFRHLTLDVDERVLIPRPETEQLVDLVLDELSATEGGVAIDVGTGSGAIAIALAAEGHFSRVYATDISRDAVDVARHNAEISKSFLRAPVDVLHGSLLGPLLDVRARAVVSNPPYIALGEAASLPASVRDWEPAVALFSGTDGLRATAQLVREAADVLAPGGLLALEVDVRRSSLVAELVSRERRFHAIRMELDLTGRERFVLARRQERDGG